MSRTNDLPNPWIRIEPWKGKLYHGQWPTLPELFDVTTERFSDRRCFTSYDPVELTFTYREAREKIIQVANYLVSRGLKKGDRVGLTGKNSPEWAIAYMAVLYAGGVLVPLDYMLKSDAIRELLEFTEAKMLFVDVEKYDEIDPDGKLGLTEKISLDPSQENYILNIDFSGTLEHEMPKPDDLAGILFTSGTTGAPKGAMLTHENFVSDCFMFQGNMNIFETDVFYALLPLHHSYSMLAVLIEGISVGAEIVFAKKLAVQQIFKDLRQGQITMLLSVPLLYNKIIKGLMKGIREKGAVVYGVVRAMMGFSGLIKKYFGVNIGKKMFKGILNKVALDTNRICICGGGPLPPSTFKYFNQLGIDFVVGYGLTEAAPGLTLNPIYAYKEGSVGKIIPGVEMKIINADEDGNGEILAKGPNVMQGYYKNEEATAEMFTEDGWLRTGDVGHIDNDRYLFLTGRKKNVIVTEGGKNVFPEEIEDEFQLYDEVEQIMIKGYTVNEAMKTEAIEAYIYPSEDFSSGKDSAAVETRLQEVIDEVNHRLLLYKRIDRFKVLEEPMEMTSTKKIKRFKVG